MGNGTRWRTGDGATVTVDVTEGYEVRLEPTGSLSTFRVVVAKKKPPSVIERLHATRRAALLRGQAVEFLVCPMEMAEALLAELLAEGYLLVKSDVYIHPVHRMAGGELRVSNMPVFPGIQFGVGCFARDVK